MAKRGYKRHARRHQPRPPRVPITIWVLHALVKFLGAKDTSPFALACVGVFGLFRGGELAYKGPKHSVLKRGNVTWLDDMVIIHLAESKTDFERKGVDVKLYKNSSLVCPYTWLRASWDQALLKDTDAPLFQLPSGLPITYAFMLVWVKAMMAHLGVPAARVGLHSFRIGGATSLAMLGVPAHIIKIFGRWESLAYQLYVQTPDASLRAYMEAMADASSKGSKMLFGGLGLEEACAISDDALDSLPRFVVASAVAARPNARRR